MKEQLGWICDRWEYRPPLTRILAARSCQPSSRRTAAPKRYRTDTDRQPMNPRFIVLESTHCGHRSILASRAATRDSANFNAVGTAPNGHANGMGTTLPRRTIGMDCHKLLVSSSRRLLWPTGLRRDIGMLCRDNAQVPRCPAGVPPGACRSCPRISDTDSLKHSIKEAIAAVNGEMTAIRFERSN